MKTHEVILSPPKQPPLPTNLRFKRADAVVDKIVDWWTPNALFPCWQKRNCRTKVTALSFSRLSHVGSISPISA
ncbi:unnamed protein product [Allacma fusca]|uniref:Uncharacterized protein n=1 Tax=Allacma fusca TaxID=39272 RepID=A0A8J2K2D8_9HEXA|nr:unnamed protein product [Allacma fusca]